jgi:hypothetical protein
MAHETIKRQVGYLDALGEFLDAARKLLDWMPDEVDGYPEGWASFDEIVNEIAGWSGEERGV